MHIKDQVIFNELFLMIETLVLLNLRLVQQTLSIQIYELVRIKNQVHKLLYINIKIDNKIKELIVQ